MAQIAIERLNADTTFLFTLSSSLAPRTASRDFPSAYTILLDPWLSGHSSLYHPSFQISRHTENTAIETLSDLGDQINLIIISQDKPDHCHQETLCSLPSNPTAKIVATPAAAKKIRSWKYFEPGVVHVLEPYDSGKPDTVFKLTLPSCTADSIAGDITIAHIPTKRDVAGLHNAIGITYQPSASLLTSRDFHITKTSDDFRPLQIPHIRKAKSFSRLRRKFSRSALSTDQSHASRSQTPPPLPSLRSDNSTSLASTHELPTPPLTPDESNHEDASLKSAPRPVTANSSWTGEKNDQPLSIIYTPHGISPHVLTPYIDHHLRPQRAFPITALFHGTTREQNPRMMGGVVANGAPGGVELAQVLKPRHWISAHDEAKDNRGLATVWIKTRVYEQEEVETLLLHAGVPDTKVWLGGVGERFWV